MKALLDLGKPMIFLKKTKISASNEIYLYFRYTGACTPGVSDSTTFHSNRSDGYGFRSKVTLSNTPDAQSSGIFMQHPG